MIKKTTEELGFVAHIVGVVLFFLFYDVMYIPMTLLIINAFIFFGAYYFITSRIANWVGERREEREEPLHYLTPEEFEEIREMFEEKEEEESEEVQN